MVSYRRLVSSISSSTPPDFPVLEPSGLAARDFAMFVCQMVKELEIRWL